MSNILIIGAASGIGSELVKNYIADGDNVIGTIRTTKNETCELDFYCDIDLPFSVSSFIENYSKLGVVWDTLILCPCNPLPVKSFFNCDFIEWEKSVNTNFINQMRMVHSLYPFRNKEGISNIVFFAGGGVNNAVIDFSAYTISKIALIKMCEFLDAENEDLNIFAVGPGLTKTKVHDIIYMNSEGKKHEEALNFINSAGGTLMDDIYGCIRILCEYGKVASGRNFSVVHDAWDTEELFTQLEHDNNMYKLRRHGNESRRSI